MNALDPDTATVFKTPTLKKVEEIVPAASDLYHQEIKGPSQNLLSRIPLTLHWPDLYSKAAPCFRGG